MHKTAKGSDNALLPLTLDLNENPGNFIYCRMPSHNRILSHIKCSATEFLVTAFRVYEAPSEFIRRDASAPVHLTVIVAFCDIDAVAVILKYYD